MISPHDFGPTETTEAQSRAVGAVQDALAQAILGPAQPGESQAERLEKARRAAPQVFSDAEGAVKGAVTDPSPWGATRNDNLGRMRPSGLDWGILKSMSKTTIIAPVIQVQLLETGKFFTPSDNPYEPGFAVRLRDKGAPKTRAAREMAGKLERFMLQLGVQRDPREALHRQTFQSFGLGLMRDSLTYDWAAIETIRPRAAKVSRSAVAPVAFRALDASTIRLSKQAMSAEGIRFDDFRTPRYVQVEPMTTQSIAEFTADELYVGVRNPVTWMEQLGYGIGELELAVSALTGWLNAFDRNAKYFEQGFNARGLLVANTKDGGALNPQAVDAFKSDLQALATGVAGAHRVPFIQGADMSFLTMGNEATDAQWTNFADMCLKLLCALYGVEPASINFLYGNTGQSGAMGSADSLARESTTRTRAVIPKVKQMFGWFDRCLIQQIDPDFTIVPTGINQDELGDYERAAKFLMAGATFNEARQKLDLPEREDGDFIGNNVGMQAAQMKMGEADEGAEQAEPMDAGDFYEAEDADRSPGAVADAGQADGPLRASMRAVRRRVTVDI